MARAVQLEVNGLAGPRCVVVAYAEWTILEVHEAIFKKTCVPVDWQTLLKGTEKLASKVLVGSLVSEDLEKLPLTLLVLEVPKPGPRALLDAIIPLYEEDPWEPIPDTPALELLQSWPRFYPGLSEVARDGWTVLHWAIDRRPTVALAILARRDFTAINAKDGAGRSVLHVAADRGLLEVCQGILGRADFSELKAMNRAGTTASQLARANFTTMWARDGAGLAAWQRGGAGLAAWQIERARRLQEVAEFLENAEAQEPEPGALLSAIQTRDKATALQLLRRRRLPGLNDVGKDGWTVLHWAISFGCVDAAMAIVARPEFSAINATNGVGWSALHRAASQGLLPLCRAILGRADFCELLLVDVLGRSASQVARANKHTAVAEFLEDAGDRVLRAQSWQRMGA